MITTGQLLAATIDAVVNRPDAPTGILRDVLIAVGVPPLDLARTIESARQLAAAEEE